MENIDNKRPRWLDIRGGGYLPNKYVLCTKSAEQKRTSGLNAVPRPTEELHEFVQAFDGAWVAGTRLYVLNPHNIPVKHMPDGTAYHLVNFDEDVVLILPRE